METLHFKISSGLKDIIGRELINDKNIAIFELVKNSYDAGARNVTITFDDENEQPYISIKDDGCGMNKDDLINKWLFVAYSEKKNQSYRDKMKRNIAGAKGVGRFSCDRLGTNACIVSKVENETVQHRIFIDWNDFEQNAKDNFADINISYSDALLDNNTSGTEIIINNLRENWNRNDLLSLKKALTQLVNPTSTESYDVFNLYLNVPREIEKDNIEKLKQDFKNKDIVNGLIKNEIFDIVREKTSQIHVEISEDGKTITSVLTDRGTQIFTTIEKNEFTLKNIVCDLYFLNRSAKLTFSKRVGVDSVNYGSIFVYKNGFRVYPYGEPGKDFFDIDQRKSQGYKRYFGTRELMGKIEINGVDNDLVETSSRNNGFIQSAHLEQLKEFFYEYILKPLEKYVVNITNWGDTDNFFDSAKNIVKYDGVAEIIKKIKTRSKTEAYISVEYAEDLFEILSNYNSSTSVDKKLDDIAASTDDTEVKKKIDDVKKHTKRLEQDIKKKNDEIEKVESEKERAEEELETTKKQAELLSARADLTAQEAIDAMHVIKVYADSIDSYIAEIFEDINDRNDDDTKECLLKISQLCDKIKNCYNLVVNSHYSVNSEYVDTDIFDFLNTYKSIKDDGLTIEIFNKLHYNPMIKINLLEFSIIIDNLVNNSIKANAKKIVFTIDKVNDQICIHCKDDGYGIKPGTDVSRMFEVGYSKTEGSGIGLSTVESYLRKIGGCVKYNPDYKEGFEVTLFF